MEADAADLGLGADGAYALAWIKLWVESYNAQTDDGPICNTLVDASATDQCWPSSLLEAPLRRRVQLPSPSTTSRLPLMKTAIKGIGGYGYCHYLFVTDNSPLPWTACAFIAYMTCTADGFSAWGKDMGGYSSNPTVAEETEANFHHSIGGYGGGRRRPLSSRQRTTAATTGGPPTASWFWKIRNTAQTLPSPSAAGSKC